MVGYTSEKVDERKYLQLGIKLTFSSGKKRKDHTTANAATEPKIQPIFTPMLGKRYGVTKVTKNAAATSQAVPNAYSKLHLALC